MKSILSGGKYRVNEITTLMKQIILPSLWETIYMIIIATILSAVIGFILAIVLVVTDEKGIKSNKIIYGISVSYTHLTLPTN